jgi:hypothetical protein
MNAQLGGDAIVIRASLADLGRAVRRREIDKVPIFCPGAVLRALDRVGPRRNLRHGRRQRVATCPSRQQRAGLCVCREQRRHVSLRLRRLVLGSNPRDHTMALRTPGETDPSRHQEKQPDFPDLWHAGPSFKLANRVNRVAEGSRCSL